jgi:hypothetical protein
LCVLPIHGLHLQQPLLQLLLLLTFFGLLRLQLVQLLHPHSCYILCSS